MEADAAPRGLSPSSYNLYSSCQRKYYLRKIAKVPIDPDASDDTEALRLGKAFHKCLEITWHELTGFTFARMAEVIAEYNLDPDVHYPLVFAMLASYKKMHEKSKLAVAAVEVQVSTPSFFGFVDVVLQDVDGGFWLGDMKTASTFQQSLMPSILYHPQINLYAAYAGYLADMLKLDPAKYRGCRYRLTTKSKLLQKSGEPVEKYLARLRLAVKSYDFIMPAARMNPGKFLELHRAAFKKTHAADATEADFAPNYSACNAFFRGCEVWSHCHNSHFTAAQNLEVIES